MFHSRIIVYLLFLILPIRRILQGHVSAFTKKPAFSRATVPRKSGLNTSSLTATSATENWRTFGTLDNEKKMSVLKERSEWTDFAASLQLYHQFQACQDEYLAGPIQSALECLHQALRLYGPTSVVCSFNGGKDAVVILHLVRAALANYYDHETRNAEGLANEDDAAGKAIAIPIRPRVVYFDHKDEFPQMMEFLKTTVKEHDLDMIAFEQGTKFQDGLGVLVDSNKGRPMSFVLGTRSTDPNAGGQEKFAPSSMWMPPFMRINCILDWTYGHVWHFLRLYNLSYCSLYDEGYTSLGTTKDTLPCPYLAVPGQSSTSACKKALDADTIPKFWPAYMLRDWDQERAGRIPKTKKKDALEVSDKGNHTALSESSEGTNSKANDAAAAPVDESSVVSYNTATTQKTVGLLVIGDEILKGFTADTNTQVAAKAMKDHNVILKRVSVVSDDLAVIVQEIRRLQQLVDVVITSGGVGPTHDDVTIKSVAEALNCTMALHDEMAQLLRDKMNGDNDGIELTEAQVKMATLPKSSKLRYLAGARDTGAWPVLQCKNVFILPGVPEFFAAKIENVAEYLSCQLERTLAYKIVLLTDENSIVPILNNVVGRYPNVAIGSYPFVSHPEYQTVITLESKLDSQHFRNSSANLRTQLDESLRCKEQDDTDVQFALNELIQQLPEGSILRVDNNDLTLFD